MSGQRDRLYELLPAVYRIADERNGRPLQALLRVIEDEMVALERDISGLYDDWFIETCSDWVIPYIGDLLGIEGMQYITSGWNLRSYVANALAYRRRKGTATVLEKVARDVTGWPAHSQEFFRLAAATQNLHHLRPACLHTPHLREASHTDYLEGPFCSVPHTADVRGIDGGYGKYNLPNIGIFLWRLQSYRLEGIEARRIDEGCYTFDPCGLDLPLFHHPVDSGYEKLLMEEQDTAGPIRPSPLRREIWSLRKEKQHIFSWDEVSGSGERQLKQELVQRCGIDWAENAKIEKSSDNKTIKASLDEESIELKLNDEKNGVNLEADGVRIAKFMAKMDQGKLKIYRNISNLPVISIEMHLENLKDSGRKASRILKKVLPEDLEVCNLSDWGRKMQSYEHGRGEVPWGRIAIDPQKGRLMIPKEVLAAIEPKFRIKAVTTSYSCGFSGDIGSGPYDRTDAILDAMQKEPLYVFGWGRIPGKDNKRLLNYLAERFGIDCNGTEKLEKIDGDKAIKVDTVDTEKKSLLLKLNNEKTEVILEIDDFRIDRLIAEMDGNRLNIYEPRWRVAVCRSGAAARGIPTFSTLSEALASWNDYSTKIRKGRTEKGTEPIDVGMKATRVGMIAIMDSRTYREDVTVEVGEGFKLLIVAAALLPANGPSEGHPEGSTDDPSHGSSHETLQEEPDNPSGEGPDGSPEDLRISARSLRPHLQGNMNILGTAGKKSESPGALVINGLLMEGDLRIMEGNLGSLVVENCTIVPGKGAIRAYSGFKNENDGLKLALRQSICGRISLAKSVPELHITGCIIDAQSHYDQAIDAEGTRAVLMESTVIGKSSFSSLTASDCIFTGEVNVRQKQVGNVRFSYLPPGSTTPSRQQCQPDTFLDRESEMIMQREGGGHEALISQLHNFLNRIYPAFNSLHYPDPAYAQLSESCPLEIRAGAEDGSEMGAFKSLQQPQRLANLQAALEEFLPIELDAGIFFVT